MSIPADRLITEALAKSGVLWLTSPSGSAPVWYAHTSDRAYVVYGPGEQGCPEHRGEIQVVARSKDTRARLASFTAYADVLNPADDDWDEATAALKSGRLNAPATDVVERWRQECTILRLTPDVSTLVVRGQHIGTQADDPAQAGHPSEGTASEPTTAPASASAAPATGSTRTSATNSEVTP